MSVRGNFELRWQGDLVAHSVALSHSEYESYIEFAASAESSTQYAFDRFSLSLEAALKLAHENRKNALAQTLERLLNWMNQWVLEEENHVLFFNTLHLRTVPLNPHSSAPNLNHFKVEQPIPAEQSWSTTLLFLLYSEIASMIWYRVWYRHAKEGTICAALRHLHRDEVEHFQKFLNFCLEIGLHEESISKNARRVLSFFALAFRKIKQNKGSDFYFNSSARGEMNWWEHSIFQKINDVDQVLSKIYALQRRCCMEIESVVAKAQ